MSITVYSKPNCVQCTATKRFLKSNGVEFNEVDVTADQEAYELVTELGYLQVPVVMAGDDHWSGFQPELLKDLV